MIISIANVKMTRGTKVRLLSGKHKGEFGTIVNEFSTGFWKVSLLTEQGIRYLMIKHSNLLKQV